MDAFLSTIPAKELAGEPQARSLITVSPHERVEDVLKKLATANIYAAPVVTDQGRVLGLVDLVDLLSNLVHIVAHQIGPGVKLGQKHDTVSKFVEHHYTGQELENIKNTFFNTPAQKVVNFSGQNAYHMLPLEGSTVKDVASALARAGVHRIVLTDSHERPLKVVSQSAVTAFLAKHLDKLGKVAEQTIEAANCMTKNLISVSPELRAIDAFVTLVENHISALVFLGEEGDVLGNLSVKDLKGALMSFNNLMLPVVEFVNIIRRETVKDIPPLVSILVTDSVGKAMQKLAAVGIHRLYIYGGSKGSTPIATVALTDILKYLRTQWV